MEKVLNLKKEGKELWLKIHFMGLLMIEFWKFLLITRKLDYMNLYVSFALIINMIFIQI